MLERKKQNYQEYRKCKAELQDYLVAERIVRELLKEEAVYDEKQTREDRDQEKNR